jgi:hypothetical protein
VALCGAARSASAQETEPPPYAAWQGNAPHAPPPAIALDAPPAPELAPLEYARRPFEFAPEFLLALPDCSDGSASNARCTGLGVGAGFGLSALWRVSPYFAFGGSLSRVGFGFNPPASTHLQDPSAGGLFYGLLGRVYFAERGPIEPYLELGLGGGSDRTSAREQDLQTYDETASGSALRVGGAVELYLGRHWRLGPAFDWTRFQVNLLRRCDAARACVDLDRGSTAHGVGFSTLSVRLTILVGPGL